MDSRKRLHFASTAIAGIWALAQHSGALAQAAPSAAANSLQEIVVTARRVTERLQDVPLSVVAMSGQELAKRQIVSLSDLANTVPNLSITGSVIPGASEVVIRGITSNPLPNVSLDQSIGHYVDGVYIARQSGSYSELPDISRVEVLRGPQGTLFGRNVTQGAINFITSDPTGHAHAVVDGTVGNYNQYRAHAIVDLPEWNGFSLRMAYLHDQRDGDVKNPLGGIKTTFSQPFGTYTSLKSYDSRDDNSYFLALRYTGIDHLTVTYKFDKADDNDGPPQQQIVGFTPATGRAYAAMVTSGLQPNGQSTVNLVSGKKLSSLPDPFATTTAIHNFGHNLTIEYQATPEILLKSISAFRGVHTRGLGSDSGADIVDPAVANSFYINLGGPQLTHQQQFSQEVQLIAHEKKFDFTGGLYFFQERGGINFILISQAVNAQLAPFDASHTIPFFPYFTTGGVVNPITYAGPAGLSSTLESAQNRSYAAYGHTDIHVTDQFDLAGGLRYTKDERKNVTNATIPRYSLSTFTFTFLTREIPAHYSGDNLSYDVSATYKFTPDVNVYARYSTGYLSGGDLGPNAFKPEHTQEEEVGLKSEWLDRRLRLNVDYYHAETQNFEEISFNATQGIFVKNSGHYYSDGVEFEANYIPFAGMNLGWDWGYNHTVYYDGRLNAAPEFQTTAVAEYSAPKFSDGSYLDVRADAVYQSAYHYGVPCNLLAASCANVPGLGDPVGTPPLPAAFLSAVGFANTQQYLTYLNKATTQGNNWVVNMRVSLMDIPMSGGHARASLWVKNLLDQQDLQNAAAYGPYIVGIYNPARTFGFDLGWSF